MEDQLVVTIKPATELASLPGFVFSIASLRSILAGIDRNVDNAVSLGRDRGTPPLRDRRRARTWFVRSLYASAPTIILTANGARPDSAPRTAAVLIETIHNVGAPKPAIPSYISDDAVATLEKLSLDLAKYQITELTLSTDIGAPNGRMASITRELGEKIKRLRKYGHKEENFIEGVIETVSVRGNWSFSIFDDLGNRSIRCLINKNKELLDIARQQLGAFVRVYGIVSYYLDGTPRTVVEVEQISVYDLPAEKGSNVFGVFKEVQDIADPVAALARARGPKNGF